MNTKNLNTWIEISEKAYAQNLNFFKNFIPKKTELSAVVKANAYGHGLKEIVKLADRHGAQSFCVHTIEEALHIREEGYKKDILIMGPVPHGLLAQAVESDFRLVLFDLDTLGQLGRISRKKNKTVRVHLKLETGTYRQGIDQEELHPFLKKLNKTPLVALEGAYTHFANIEDTTDHTYAFSQLELFESLIGQIRLSGFSDLKQHAACSAAALLFPKTHFDMVRLGISQYGLWPSPNTFVSFRTEHSEDQGHVLLPVLSWKARVGQVKNVPAYQSIGYGCTYQTTRNTRLAVLPIGYADGYSRGLGNLAYVLLGGRRAPVRGRVCMNMTMVDVTDIPGVKIGDEAVLIGKQGNDIISVNQLATLAGTIHYEFVTRINWHIPRFITDSCP
jgi:alanine racemase